MFTTVLSLTVPSRETVSEIFVQQGLLKETYWIDLLKKISNRFAIITDDVVKDLFGYLVKNKLEEHGCYVDLFAVPQGETSKTCYWKQTLEEYMMSAGLGRDAAVIAVGGGVVTDLGGFIAATYCRGIPFVSIPTSLLAQVDASIGGKVGINTSYGKNLIGAFYHPQLILIDSDMLSTLPERELLNGMAEVIKYALISSQDLFAMLQHHVPYEILIRESCSLKKEIVEKDPQEKGLRRILNFGHTVGHALETLTSYRISHGQAVAIGMRAEAYLSYLLGYLKREEITMITTLLDEYGFSFQLSSAVKAQDLMETMKRDKKALGSQPRFVLLEGIGETVAFDGTFCSHVDPKLIMEMLVWIQSR